MLSWLSWVYAGQLNLDNWTSAQYNLINTLSSLNYLKIKKTEKGLFYYTSNNLFLPKISFSLEKQSLSFNKKESTDLVFENKIEWINYRKGFEEYFNEFLPLSRKLIEFYEGNGLRCFSTYTANGKTERDLFDKKILKI